MSVHVSGGDQGNPGLTFNGMLTDGLYLSTPGVEGQDGIGHAISASGKTTIGGTTLFFTPDAGMAYQAPLNDNDHVPASPLAGSFYFNTFSSTFQFYDGASWNSLLLFPETVINLGLIVFGENNLIADSLMPEQTYGLYTYKVFKLGDGTASAPSYGFDTGMDNPGMYLSGSGELCFSYNDLLRASFGDGSSKGIETFNCDVTCEEVLTLNGTSRIFASDGAAGNPSYTNSSRKSGFFYTAGGLTLCGSVAGARVFQVSSVIWFDTDLALVNEFEGSADFSGSTSSGQFLVNMPSSGYAAVHHSGHNTTGFYFDIDGFGNIHSGIICGGVLALSIWNYGDSRVGMDQVVVGDSTSKYLRFRNDIVLASGGSTSEPFITFGESDIGISYIQVGSDKYFNFNVDNSVVLNFYFYCASIGVLYVGYEAVLDEPAVYTLSSLAINTLSSDGSMEVGASQGMFFSGISPGTISYDLKLDDPGTELFMPVSSIKHKYNITDIAVDYKSIFNLTPVSFTYTNGGRRSFGFIAEDAEAFAPWAMFYDKEGKADSFNYTNMIATVIPLVQDFIRRGDELFRRFIFTPGAEPFDPSRAIVSLAELKKNKEYRDDEITKLYIKNEDLKKRVAAVKSILVGQGR